MFRSNKILTLSGFLLLVMLAGCSDGSDNQRVSVEEAVQAQGLCRLPEEDIAVNTTANNIEFVRTPDACFDNLDDYPFSPNYVEVDGLRYHFVDEGPRDGEVILLLHGQPTWSYLYRKMIPVLVEAGYRVVAPDHIGMGRSDKPVDPREHQYEQHVAWMKSFVSELDLTDITLFVQDWGSLIGLRMAGDDPDKFARIVLANGDLALIPDGFNPFTVPVFEFDETIEGDRRTFVLAPHRPGNGFPVLGRFRRYSSASVCRGYGRPLDRQQFERRQSTTPITPRSRHESIGVAYALSPPWSLGSDRRTFPPMRRWDFLSGLSCL